MAQKLDQIIVIDIESTCWESTPPEGQVSDVIEIGICLLDTKTFERSRKESILVKPERSSVSEFCTQLTTLTQAQVDTGISFHKACAYLSREFGARDRTWASYGDYDRVALQHQCQEMKIHYPMNRTHLNVKNLFALSCGLSREIGLDRALVQLGLPMEGTHHRGHDDAWNISAILAILLKRMRAAHPVSE
jgi:inhibitor of KinA sporulation pathway (predicted exonuclease)